MVRRLFREATSSWAATLEGLSCLPPLWMAIGLYAVLNAFTGAWAAVALPFQVVEGFPLRGAVITVKEIQVVLLPPLIIAAFFLVCFVYLLGGTISSAGRLMRRESVSVKTFFQEANLRFVSMIKWLTGAAFLMSLSGLTLILATIFVWVLSKEAFLVQVVSFLAFLVIVVPTAMCLLYSPVVVVNHGSGFWSSLSSSCRFLRCHFWGTIWLFLWVGWIGVLLGVLWLFPVFLVDWVCQRVGMDPYTWSFSTIFFPSFVLWVPMAVIAVYFPAVLFHFYYSKTFSLQ